MRKPKRPFLSGKELPKNVYHTNKPNFLYKKWRYNIPKEFQAVIGAKELHLKTEDENEVIEWAKRIEEGLKQVKEKNLTSKTSRRVSSKQVKQNQITYKSNQVGYWVQRWITFELPKYKMKPNSEQNLGYDIPAFFKDVMDRDVNRLKPEHLWPRWSEMSYCRQNSLRPNLRRCVRFMVENGVAQTIKKEGNPFLLENQGGFSYTKKTKKLRGKLTQDRFKNILGKAKELDKEFLYDAMLLSYHTYLRVADCLSLDFGKHIVKVGNKTFLKKVLIKSENREDIKPTLVVIDLDSEDNKELKNLINRLRLKSNPKCSYVIQDKGNPVPYNKLSASFRRCWDALPGEEEKTIRGRYRPTFHEIRHLRLHIDKDVRNVLIDEISPAMGHKDKRVTQDKYDTHTEFDIHYVNHGVNLSDLDQPVKTNAI